MSQTFLKSHRLILKKDFEYMKSNSSHFREEFVLFVHKPSRIEAATDNRIGFIVSKKNGNAVRRNKIKRILRNLFRSSKLRERPESPRDLLIVANIPKLTKSDDLTKVIEPLFKRAEKKLLGT